MRDLQFELDRLVPVPAAFFALKEGSRKHGRKEQSKGGGEEEGGKAGCATHKVAWLGTKKNEKGDEGATVQQWGAERRADANLTVRWVCVC